MGAIKTNNYTADEWNVSLVARGISHPARVYIIKELRRHPYRNIDFCEKLQMNRSTIKEHIDKLLEAELICVDYQPHFYWLSINQRRIRPIEQLLEFMGESAY